MANIFINILSNQPPSVDDKTITIPNASTYTFSVADFTVNYQDPEGDVFSKIRITTLPASGSLLYGGTVISSSSLPFEVLEADINIGKLQYSADPNNSSAHSTQFSFEVCDNRGACG